MELGTSKQFGCPSVVITTKDLTAEAVIQFAEKNGAIFHDGEENCLVLDLQTDQRQVGPETYTYNAARRMFKNPTAAA